MRTQWHAAVIFWSSCVVCRVLRTVEPRATEATQVTARSRHVRFRGVLMSADISGKRRETAGSIMSCHVTRRDGEIASRLYILRRFTTVVCALSTWHRLAFCAISHLHSTPPVPLDEPDPKVPKSGARQCPAPPRDGRRRTRPHAQDVTPIPKTRRCARWAARPRGLGDTVSRSTNTTHKG